MKFQGDLIMVYDSHHNRKIFKILPSEWFGPYILFKVFFGQHMNWFTFMERNMVGLITTNSNIFIMAKLFFQKPNNKISVK
jgi:hypothetical protein